MTQISPAAGPPGRRARQMQALYIPDSWTPRSVTPDQDNRDSPHISPAVGGRRAKQIQTTIFPEAGPPGRRPEMKTADTDPTYPRQLNPQVGVQNANDSPHPQQLEPQLVGIARSKEFIVISESAVPEN